MTLEDSDIDTFETPSQVWKWIGESSTPTAPATRFWKSLGFRV